jgi:hypothetical protein
MESFSVRALERRAKKRTTATAAMRTAATPAHSKVLDLGCAVVVAAAEAVPGVLTVGDVAGAIET